MNTSNSPTTTALDTSSGVGMELNPVTVSLTLAAHSQAQHFRRQHPQPAKAKQVYLNTLAIYAVKTYLERAGFEVDVSAGQSWDIAQQTLLDVADLIVQGHGVVECRPVLPHQTVMQVPPDIWSEVPPDSQAQTQAPLQRQGYVAVQLETSLKSATLLGFIDSADRWEVCLTDLLPLDDLIPHLLHSSPISEPQVKIKMEMEGAAQDDRPISLKQWLDGVQNDMSTGWQQVTQWLGIPEGSEPQLAWRFRSEFTAAGATDGQPMVIRRKVLPLGTASNPVEVALTVGMVEHSERSGENIEIWVQVTPVADSIALPPHLVLMVLDNVGEVVMQAQSRSTEIMQLRFGVDDGELFSLQLTLDDVSMTESFVL